MKLGIGPNRALQTSPTGTAQKEKGKWPWAGRPVSRQSDKYIAVPEPETKTGVGSRRQTGW